jgi:4-diphosphocytidyl-2-C-methyl-D-erythritol kinase
VTQTLTTRAPAKINLTLAVVGRRADGYHLLESLVGFAGVGDTLRLDPGPDLTVIVSGPFGHGAGLTQDNLVLRAARHLQRLLPGTRGGTFHLVKRLPVASGIGGGSSDAAGALRLLGRLNRIGLDHPAMIEAARATGADVPVCLEARARMMAGIGDELGPRLTLPRLFAVLVNPGVHVPTPAVFTALGLPAGRSSATGTISGDIAAGGNDLEAPAVRIAPVIGEVLAALRATRGSCLARMSGSGATCFGLYDDCGASADAAKSLRTAYPSWWIKPTLIR